MTYVIGLTGGIASGKSNLSAALHALGAEVIDADRISRALTAPGGPALPAIRAAFGNSFFHGEELDRKALGRLVFSDPEALNRLNGLTHPLILQEIRERLRALEQAGVPVCVLDAPLLYEAGLDSLCDTVWCAWLPKEQQIRRLRERDGLTRKEAKRRIASQMPPREKKRRSDLVIDTRGSREESAAQAEKAYLAVLSEQTQKPMEEHR